MGRRVSEAERGPVLGLVSYVLAGVTALTLGPAWLMVLRDGDAATATPAFVVAGVLALGAVIVGHLAIVYTTKEAGDRVFFETVFPAVMSLVPVAGPFIALWCAVGLLRGRLPAATITTNSSSTSYEATRIGRAGAPVALVLIMLAASQPLAVWAIQNAVNAPPDEATARAARYAAYSQAGCGGVADCYTQAAHVGQVAGRAVLEIDARGAVTAVDLTLPDTPAPIDACVRGLLAGRALPDFADPAGTLTCSWAGSVSGATQAVQIDGEFRPQVEGE